MRFSTSWDDGHPLDLQLADLLAHHGFAGTFYVPKQNREGLPVMQVSQLRNLETRFEIGSHTLDHCYANACSPPEWRSQVQQGKAWLEDTLGHAVAGFCYPGGKYNAVAKQVVMDSGFSYARTVVNLHLDAGHDRFEIPTTLQFYPHGRAVLARNWVRYGQWPQRLTSVGLAMLHSSHHGQLMALLEQAQRDNGVFHIWGHSWELEQCQLWPSLANFLKLADTVVPRTSRVDNAGLAKLAGALGSTTETATTALP